MAEYLKLHPEMAHELMVPSGFKQCLIRRYERYLSGTQMLSTQNGAAKHGQWDKEIFDALLPEEVNVVGNPSGTTTIPTWRELCHFVCTNGTCTVDGEAMAPQYEYKATGEKVRIIKYGMLKGKLMATFLLTIILRTSIVEVTEKQWHLMWSHVVCQFAKPYGDDAAIYSTNHDQIEFIALHKAYTEMASTPQPWNDWQWPIGQQIAIILKQLESRLRGIHKRVPTWRCELPMTPQLIHVLD